MSESASADAVGLARRWLLPRSVLSGVICVIAAFAIGALLIAAIGRDPVLAYLSLFEASLAHQRARRRRRSARCPGVLRHRHRARLPRRGVQCRGGRAAVHRRRRGSWMARSSAASRNGWCCRPWRARLRRRRGLVGDRGGAEAEVPGGRADRHDHAQLHRHLLRRLPAAWAAAGSGLALARTARLAAEARLPMLLEGTRLHAGLLLVVLVGDRRADLSSGARWRGSACEPWGTMRGQPRIPG